MTQGLEARYLGLADREAALRYLERDSQANLFLMDLTARLGAPPEPGEARAEIVGAWRNDEIVGMAGLRPSVVLDASADEEAVEVFLPYLESMSGRPGDFLQGGGSFPAGLGHGRKGGEHQQNQRPGRNGKGFHDTRLGWVVGVKQGGMKLGCLNLMCPGGLPQKL